MTAPDPDISKDALDAADAAENERAAQIFDQGLRMICQALRKLGIDNQRLLVTKNAHGDYIVSILSVDQKQFAYARVSRDGSITLLGDQIKPPNKSAPHPAELE